MTEPHCPSSFHSVILKIQSSSSHTRKIRQTASRAESQSLALESEAPERSDDERWVHGAAKTGEAKTKKARANGREVVVSRHGLFYDERGLMVLLGECRL